MVAGDSQRRDFALPVPDPERSFWTATDMTQDALSQKATGFNCMSGRREPEPALTRYFLPDKPYLDANCDQGVRFELIFPSCWNGRDLDSADHRSHVQYPHLVNTGSCPPDYPVRPPSLYYETIWATSGYSSIDGSFVIANGDTTGYGYHGDFMSGWEEQFL
ncbi:hypothetical protein LTS18_007283 [Coniosporium uncinatum]|uniref:Uncharacterized protein n=1 Tax=Coniosporium uncinatum TaxID=93489 RepID=A0ACC3DX33_9PEZI|nr:hypothetical protein LTS18_007283 [Coniosporium uncinatum]